jgi:hypothetical protein
MAEERIRLFKNVGKDSQVITSRIPSFEFLMSSKVIPNLIFNLKFFGRN